MEVETKLRLDDIDRRFSDLNKKIDDQAKRVDDQGKRFDDQGKRVDDVKWAIDRIASIFGVIFTVVVIFAGYNYTVDRERLKDFETDIKDLLKKTDETKLDLLGSNFVDLPGQEITASLVKSPRKSDLYPDQIEEITQLTFSFVIKNTGDNTSGPMFMKFYTGKGVPLVHRSTDENKFDFEEYLPPDSLQPNFVPAKMSVDNTLNIFVPDATKVVPGKHSALLKVYYGKAKVVSAPIFLTIEKGGT